MCVQTGQPARLSLLTIELRTDGGEVLEQIFDESAVRRIRPPLDETSSACLRFIDPYGDTVFNSWQAAALSVELEGMADSSAVADDRERVTRVIELAKRCADGVHVCLWFVGD